MWAATLTTKVAVGAGKGSAKAEIIDGYGTTQQTTTATNSTVQTITFGMSIIRWAKSKYTATAATGYTFDAWYTDAACTSGKQTKNPYETSQSQNKARTDQYWAKFTPNKYTVKFNGNGYTGGSTADQAFTYDAAQNLTANGFERKYKVTYAPNEGTCDKSDETAVYTFAGWAESATGAKKYNDKASVSNLAASGTVTLYAVWNSASVTLPAATREDFNFLGWFNGETKAGDAGASYTPTANITLKAQWQPVARVATAPAAVADLVYTGENQTLISAGKAVNGTLQYSLDGENYSTELPQAKDAKTYTVYYKVEALEGGVGVDAASFEVTIAKADPTVTTAPAAIAELVYNGEDQTLISAGEAENGTFQYSLDNAAFAAELPTGKDAKTYDVYYKVIGNDNYNDIEFATPIEVAIAKADVTLTAPVAYDTLAYNGLDQELITAGEVAGGTLLYSADGETFSAEIPTAKEAGEYTVYYRVDADGNHNDVEKTAIAVSIAKANAAVTTEPVAYDTLAYNGADQELIIAGQAAGGEMQYSLDGENYATTIPTAKEIGNYTVYYKVAGDANHNDVDAATIAVSIAKPRAVLTQAPAAIDELVYNGNVQTLITAGQAEGGELQYSLDGENYATTLPEGTNAQTYTVYYRIIADENHSDLAAATLEATIAKAALSVTAEGKQTTYGVEAPAFTVAYKGFIGEETDAVLEGELAFACDYTVGNNAGEYVITPSGLDAVNYDITFNNGTLTVNKAALSVTAVDTQTTYGAEAPEFTVAYEGFIGEETEAVLTGELAFACEYTVGNNAGEYVITPSGLDAVNYDITFNDGTLTVNKAALSVTAVDKDTTYGAPAPEFTAAYVGFLGEDNIEQLTGKLAFACEYTVGNNAGEYVITPSGLDAVNYDITFNNGTLTVNKAALSVTAVDKDTTYGAPAPEFTAAYVGFLGEDNIEQLTGELAFACEYTVGSNAGEYIITPSGLDAVNYDITFNNGTLTVAKVDVELVAPVATNAVYTGEPLELITAGEVVGGELQYSLKANKDFSTEIPTRTDVGFYQVFYRVVGDQNHNDVAATVIMARIVNAQAVLTVEPAAVEELVYTGSDLTLVTAGEAEGGTVQYSLDGENYDVTLPTATNAGDYTVYYKVVGDGTHSDLEPATLNVSIAKADAAVAVAPEAVENLVANGEDHELVTAGQAEGGTMVYSLDGENFSAELPVASEEGDYTVTYKVQGDENHNNSEAAELTVTIEVQGTATAVDNSRSQVTVKKIIRDNQVLIIREGRTYTTAGLLVE